MLRLSRLPLRSDFRHSTQLLQLLQRQHDLTAYYYPQPFRSWRPSLQDRLQPQLSKLWLYVGPRCHHYLGTLERRYRQSLDEFSKSRHAVGWFAHLALRKYSRHPQRRRFQRISTNWDETRLSCRSEIRERHLRIRSWVHHQLLEKIVLVKYCGTYIYK